MDVKEFQKLVKKCYYHRDVKRGKYKTFLWLVEEVGELADGLKSENKERIEEEISDVLAWCVSLANLYGIDVEKGIQKKYGKGCPKCGGIPCSCEVEV